MDNIENLENMDNNKNMDNMDNIDNIENMDNIENIDNIEYYTNELLEKGYTIIPNILNVQQIDEFIMEFNKWMDSVEDIDYLHSIIHYHGIFKYFQVAHQRFAWLLRTNKKIQNVFKAIWNTEELVCSFDGCCYFPKNTEHLTDQYWIHSDQSSLKKGRRCVQSFISLTENKEKTFVVYEGSHLLHEEYSEMYNIDNPSDWNPIMKEYVDSISDRKKILHVNAGSLVLWDSRTFHQNTCGNKNSREDRLVQYLCFLPKNSENNDLEQEELRIRCFESLRTTNHWPYPITPVCLQPQTYNYYNPESKIKIDYKNLPEPRLDDLYPEILKVL